jgi:LPXTG-motif cell wall-anchored protein
MVEAIQDQWLIVIAVIGVVMLGGWLWTTKKTRR